MSGPNEALAQLRAARQPQPQPKAPAPAPRMTLEELIALVGPEKAYDIAARMGNMGPGMDSVSPSERVFGPKPMADAKDIYGPERAYEISAKGDPRVQKPPMGSPSEALAGMSPAEARAFLGLPAKPEPRFIPAPSGVSPSEAYAGMTPEQIAEALGKKKAPAGGDLDPMVLRLLKQ